MLSNFAAHASEGGYVMGSSTPFQRQQHQQQCHPASASPVSSTSAGTALHGAPSCTGSQQSGSPLEGLGSCAETSYCAPSSQQQQGYAGMLPGGAAPKRFNASRYIQDKEWLYRLITFPSYFTPCGSCCGSARTPKREQLMTQFDTEYPYRVYCSHCPECKDRVNSGCLLQVRRSAFKDVVKALDIQRFGADVAGVQQYTLNGSKVIYLNREQTPEKKGNNTNAAPAACSVDGRAMMDKSSCYCSLKCKLIAEDVGFTAWLDKQDPSVRILALAAANAPPRPTAASTKRPGGPDSSTSSGGSGAVSPGCADAAGATSRPVKLARTDSTGAASCGRPALGAGLQLQRAASATPAAPTGLKRIRISLPGNRQGSAPSRFLEAALTSEGPQLGGTGSVSTGGASTAAAAAAAMASNSWLGLDLDHALSCSMDGTMDDWDLDSPSFTAAGGKAGGSFSASDSGAFENDGSMSPALINAPSVFSAGSADDWWLCGSPMDRAFTCAGMGALLNTDAGLGGCAGDDLFGGLDDMLVPPMAAASPGSLGGETTTLSLQW